MKIAKGMYKYRCRCGTIFTTIHRDIEKSCQVCQIKELKAQTKIDEHQIAYYTQQIVFVEQEVKKLREKIKKCTQLSRSCNIQVKRRKQKLAELQDTQPIKTIWSNNE